VRTVTVVRSYDHYTAKGGHVDVIPIADPPLPIPREAVATSTSEQGAGVSERAGRDEIAEIGCGEAEKPLRPMLVRAGRGKLGPYLPPL